MGNTVGAVSAARRRYLDAAARLLTNHPEPLYPYALSHLSVSAMAERLDVQRTSIYRLWPSQSALWSDLVIHVLTEDARRGAQPPIGDQWRAHFDGMHQSLLTDPATVLRSALLAYTRPANFELLLLWSVTQRIDVLEDQIVRLLQQLGRAPLEPLVARDLAVAVYCFSDGLAYAGRLTDRVNQHEMPTAQGCSGLLAYAMGCLLESCTRPLRSDDRLSTGRPVAPAVPRLRHTRRQAAVMVLGAEMFAESLVQADSPLLSDPLGHLSLAKIARFTGVTRQAVQANWSNQREFSLDLMRYLHQRENAYLLDSARRGMRAAAEAECSGTYVATDVAVRRLNDTTQMGSMGHLAFAPHFANPEVREIGRVERERTLDAASRDLRAIIGDRARPRHGTSLFDLASLLLLGEAGAARLSRIDPTALRAELPHRGGRASAFAICVEAIVTSTLERTSVMGEGVAVC